uniref:C2H2-type domain-containing protein n=1 Tax=Strongyloides stercoralis TaxID=6248 RepID=A0A0K0E127_STRER
MGIYTCGRNFNNQPTNYEHHRITSFMKRNPHNISSWKDVGIGSGIKVKSAEKSDARRKRKKYIKNGGFFIFICHFTIVFAMCVLTLNEINHFQQQGNVEIVNLIHLPNFLKILMKETENFGIHIIISCFVIEVTSLYFTKARTNFLDVMSLCLFMVLGYFKSTDNDGVEGIFVELALMSMTSVVTFANLVLPKLPKHKTKPNSIMSAFHMDSPSSQCESSVCEFTDINGEEEMDVDEYKSDTDNILLNRLKFRDTTRDDTPIREIRPLLNNFKLDNNSENSFNRQKDNVFSRSNLISNQQYNRPIFKKPLFTRESYLESKNEFYKSSSVPQLPNENRHINTQISQDSGYFRIRKLYVYIGLIIIMANTFFNIFSFYQKFQQNW